MTPFQKLLMLCVFSVVTGACAVDRSGFGRAPDPVSWDVVPPYFCPGDPVTVSWDFSSMRKDRANCRPPNGGFASLTTCTYSRDCPVVPGGAECRNGYCCRNELSETPGHLMCDSGDGCYPAFDITITADTLTLDPPVDHERTHVRGSRTVWPATTTTFNISGYYAGRTPYMFAPSDGKTATMVRPEPPTSYPLKFEFTCTGATPGWKTVDLNTPPPATEHVRIVEVGNVSGHAIVVQRTGSAPVPLGPSENTERLNGTTGKVDGIWSARLSPSDPASLSAPRCGPTEVSNPWPDLYVDLKLICVVD